ncbi:MAG: hypothetical protein V1806_04455 [Pseudomonadota bacterium]
MQPTTAPAPQSRASWPHVLAVVALLCLLSLVMTWPLAANLSTSVNDYGDPLLNSWILWWDFKALTTPGLSWFNAPMFHPSPLTLAYSEHMLANALLAAPVFMAGGDAILAHNVVFLLSFVLSGLGAYLLGWQLTRSRGAALVCALGFAFAPYRFGHLGHLQLQTAQFMPLVLLYLHRWALEPRWRHIWLMGLFWLLQILSCGYYALFVSLALGLFLLFYGLRGGWWRQARRWRQMAAVTLAVGLLVLPLYLPYMQVKKDLGFVRSQDNAASFAALPRHYLAAPPASLLYGQLTAPFRGSEGELFLGLGLSARVALGLLPRRRPARPGPEDPRPAGWWRANPQRAFYLLLAVLAFWASLGPSYGLYALLYRLVPGFDTLRVPARLAVLVTLAWAVLAAYGWQRLAALWPGRVAVRRLALSGACLLMLLESCSVPVPWLQVYDFTPPVYQWLAAQPAGSVVFEAPTMGHMGDQARDARYLYWSTKHQQPLVNGYSGFFPPGYRQMTQIAGRLPDTSELLPELRRRGARLLVLHLKEYPPAARHGLLKALRRNPELGEVFSSEWDYAFEIKPAPTGPGA